MDDKLLLRRLTDLSERAEKSGLLTASGFLTPSEAQLARSASRVMPIAPLLDGGYDGAERVIAVFAPDDAPPYGGTHPLAGLHITHAAPLGHRDILGSILGLGLERTVLGDIAIGQSESRAVVLRSALPFLLTHFGRAGRIPVKVGELPLESFAPPVRSFEERKLSVASARLDAVVAAVWGLSREAAQNAIRAGLVRLNHREALRPDSTISEGDTLAFKGHGKLDVAAFDGLTRRGRMRIIVNFYV